MLYCTVCVYCYLSVSVALDEKLIRQATFADAEYEEEVDDLVAWTKGLDENKID